MRTPSSLRIDSPSWPLLLALISYWGTTDNDGNVAGTTIRCGGLATEPPYENHALKILTGPSAGQTRDLTLHPAGTDTLTVANAFTNVTGAAQQILAGTLFVILSKTPAIAEVAALVALVTALMADVGDPTGETLPSLATKWGDIARSLDLILGDRWDAAGDLGTDITAIIATLASIVQVYQEQIPDTDFALAAIDNALTVNPPNADPENSIVDIDQVVDSTFVLRSLWVNVTSLGTAGTKLTFGLWVPLNGVVTQVDSVDVAALGIQNLVDLFGLQEVHADGIWITVLTDSASADAACSGTFRYAEAKK